MPPQRATIFLERLLVATVGVGSGGGQLEAVERALASQSFASVAGSHAAVPRGVRLLDQHRQQRIVPQLIVVVEVLVSQGQPIDPLRDEFQDRMFHELWIAVIAEAASQLTQDAGGPLDWPARLARSTGPQQQPSRVGGDLAAVKAGNHARPAQPLKLETLLRTLCHQGAAPVQVRKSFWQTPCARRGSLFPSSW